MKYSILFLFLSLQVSAQDCYNGFRDKGIAAYETLDFEKALNQFRAAKICDDKPQNDDVDEWITKTQSGYIDAIKQARDEALALRAEAERLLAEAKDAKREATALRFFAEGQEREFKQFYLEALDSYNEAIKLEASEIMYREQRAQLTLNPLLNKFEVARVDLLFLKEHGDPEKKAKYNDDLAYVEDQLGNDNGALVAQQEAVNSSFDMEQRDIYDKKVKAYQNKRNTGGGGANEGEILVKLKKEKGYNNCDMNLLTLTIDGKTFKLKGDKFDLSSLPAGAYPYTFSGTVKCPDDDRPMQVQGKNSISLRHGAVYSLYWTKNKLGNCMMRISNY